MKGKTNSRIKTVGTADKADLKSNTMNWKNETYFSDGIINS